MRWSEADLAKHLARRTAAPPAASSTRKRRGSSRHAVPIEASETAIHEAIVAHLRTRGRRGVPWFHVPNGELREPAIAAKLQRMGTKPGVPDLLLLIDGRLHGLELKRERGGVLSADQRAMHEALRSAGAVIDTARGLDEAVRLLEQWGALLPTSRRIGP